MCSASPFLVSPFSSAIFVIWYIPMATASPWLSSFIVEVLLNGVGKGMSEVQENPLSGIKLVFFHNAAFDIDTGCDHIG